MSKIKQIQELIRNGLYYLIEHAYEEAAADDFDIYDMEQGILTGKIRKRWSRKAKYEVVGLSLDGRPIGIICRITLSGKVRIITVHENNLVGGTGTML